MANETQSTKRWNRTTTTVKNPNWLEANQLEVEPGTTKNRFSEWSEWVLNPGGKHPNHWARRLVIH